MTILHRPSLRNQRRLTRLLQVVLGLIVAFGVVAGEPKSIVNGSVALGVTTLPALLERNYEIPLDPWLGLWITTAVFLHTIGSAGLYGLIPWWDHLTHGMSASLIAGVGYTTARAVDLHTDEVHIPRRFAFVFIVITVLSFGVIWELFEYGLDITARQTGMTMPLAQHGLDDTIRDLIFNTIGAIVIGVFGQAHLTDIADVVREELFRDR